tara:strand:+ start:635 stop:1507 length:873 start_codon:yes stop_codon:yes gene_type:complete
LVKGIILAGGNGSRLYPLTLGMSKQLLPVYDKPMIYYPLSIFIRSGIKYVLIITTIEDSSNFKKLLGDGSRLGINISYATQESPNGIAESFIIGSNFIGDDDVSLILGDNIFHGKKLFSQIEIAKQNLKEGFSSIFGVKVENPENFGVIEFDSNNEMLNINEKPLNPKSNVIVSGLYFYTNDVIKVSKGLSPSSRGEKEITDINNYYLHARKLKLNFLDDETSWIDTGTYSSLIRASKFFEDYEINNRKKVSCIEEIAFKMGYINKNQLKEIATSMENSDYGQYLLNIIK